MCVLTSLPVFKLNEWRERKREREKREKIDILVHVVKGKRICNKIAPPCHMVPSLLLLLAANAANTEAEGLYYGVAQLQANIL